MNAKKLLIAGGIGTGLLLFFKAISGDDKKKIPGIKYGQYTPDCPDPDLEAGQADEIVIPVVISNVRREGDDIFVDASYTGPRLSSVLFWMCTTEESAILPGWMKGAVYATTEISKHQKRSALETSTVKFQGLVPELRKKYGEGWVKISGKDGAEHVIQLGV